MNNPTSDTYAGFRSWGANLVGQYRTPISILAHVGLFGLSLFCAFGLAFNFHSMGRWFPEFFLPLLAIALPIKLVVLVWMRQYRCSWRYVGLRDLLSLVRASYISSFGFLAVYFILENVWQQLPFTNGRCLIDNDLDFRLPQSVFLLDCACTVGAISMARVVVRLYYEDNERGQLGPMARLLIVGAGDTGEVVLREILRMRGDRYDVVGFLDNKTSRLGNQIHGVEVIGRADHIKTICEAHDVDEVLIALPKASPKEIRRLVELCQGMNLRFRTIPPVSDLITGNLEVSPIRPVEIDDLLGREPVQLDEQAIGAVLANQRIAVTGAGGSIGSEMCRQIARFGPERLILIEQAENALFEIHRELLRAFPDINVIPYVADICDATRLRNIFERECPRVVYHAAAHKHVPMMEANPGEAIKNNIIGTKVVADSAVQKGVEKMVMISTDKAVNPTSVMGCTKRIAELYVQQLSDARHTQFVTVRFGNVLGSSGSVVPIFKAQIAAGNPVTVTHPEMTRYFMTIPEAAQLVLQAGVMGQGGEVFVLDMGEPVKIVELARDMITLSGLRPDIDIDIVFSGIRPGEKLFEELSVEGEDFSSTKHPKIAIWQKRPEDWQKICEGIDQLYAIADTATPAQARAELSALVPEYQPPNHGTGSTRESAPAST
ncbi:MAG: polysaccharide biosynthesis protein [Phycisphaerae bacterium]|nr:polysaccharide biosynthesis protein [Phycisphaerae bacterium]